MLYYKFPIPEHFFQLTGAIVATGNSLSHLSIVPNFENAFVINREVAGSVVSFYKVLAKSQIGYYSVLHVKGIGFKVFYFKRLHALYFSLGYNHIVKYRLPSDVSVKVRKQYLLFFSYDKNSIGKSIFHIQHLRFPDPYRGKGIRFRFQIMNFKPGKQR